MSDLDAVFGHDREAPVSDGYDDFDDQPMRAQRRRRAVWGAMVVLLLLLVVIGVVFGPTEWRLFQARGTRLDTPKQAAGLTLDDTSDARDTADYLRTVLDARIALHSTTGAVYQDAGGAARSVILIGGTGLASNPGHRLDIALSLISDESGSVTGVRQVPAGPLGGAMKCGTTATDGGGSMTVCGWADYGSVALALLPGRTVDEAAALTRDLRGAVEHRS